MKILFLTPRIPYPPHKGDQAVAFHRLRTLGQKHEITLLTFVEGDEDPRAEIALRKYCQRIIRVSHPRWRIAWNLISKGLFSELPLQAIYYNSPDFRQDYTRSYVRNLTWCHPLCCAYFPILKV